MCQTDAKMAICLKEVTMKLAEALILRSDLQTKLAALQQRIADNVMVQEGEAPTEEPQALLQDALAVNRELYALIERIHRTNASAQTIAGRNLLAVLNEHDALTSEHRLLQHTIDQANRENRRYSSNEIRWVKTVQVGQLQQQADGISAKLRHNNLEIQASNWQVDLL